MKNSKVFKAFFLSIACICAWWLYFKNTVSTDIKNNQPVIGYNHALFKQYWRDCGEYPLRMEQLYLKSGQPACEKFKNRFKSRFELSSTYYDSFGLKLQIHREGSEVYFFSAGRDKKPYTCDDIALNGEHERGGFCLSTFFGLHPTRKNITKLKK